MSKCLLVLNRVDQKWIQIVLIIHICTSSTANTAVCRHEFRSGTEFQGEKCFKREMFHRKTLFVSLHFEHNLIPQFCVDLSIPNYSWQTKASCTIAYGVLCTYTDRPVEATDTKYFISSPILWTTKTQLCHALHSCMQVNIISLPLTYFCFCCMCSCHCIWQKQNSNSE